MRNSSPRTLPSSLKGTPRSRKKDIALLRLVGAIEITMRDCDSLKSAASVEACVSPAQPARLPPQFSRLTSAPNKPPGLKQHSASATARPPSEQSCALFTRPPRIKSRTTLAPQLQVQARH